MILAAEGIGFHYPGHAPILADVDLHVDAGEIVCILGPNGVGKSTLLLCLSGLMRPSAGAIRLCGDELAKLAPDEIGRKLALVQQFHEIAFSFSVRTIVEMGRAPHLGALRMPGPDDRVIVDAALATFGLTGMAETPVIELSGGERQIVMIARAFAQQPRLFILDEPTAHLDFANRARFLDRIAAMTKAGAGVLFTTHFPDEAFAVADRTLLLRPSGRPHSGATRDILTEERLSDVYGVPVAIIETPAGTTCVARRGEMRASASAM